jgi:hypothetical protein
MYQMLPKTRNETIYSEYAVLHSLYTKVLLLRPLRDLAFRLIKKTGGLYSTIVGLYSLMNYE